MRTTALLPGRAALAVSAEAVASAFSQELQNPQLTHALKQAQAEDRRGPNSTDHSHLKPSCSPGNGLGSS